MNASSYLMERPLLLEQPT